MVWGFFFLADWKTCTAVSHQRQEEQHRIASQRTRQPRTQDQPHRETVSWIIVVKISSWFPVIRTGLWKTFSWCLMTEKHPPHTHIHTSLNESASASCSFVLVVSQVLWREEKFGAKVLCRHERVPDPRLKQQQFAWGANPRVPLTDFMVNTDLVLLNTHWLIHRMQ